MNYNAYPDGKKLTPDRNIAIRVCVSSESDVVAVKALSPDSKEDRTLKDWTIENGKLSMTLDDLSLIQ